MTRYLLPMVAGFATGVTIGLVWEHWRSIAGAWKRIERRALQVIDSWPDWLLWAVCGVLVVVLAAIVVCEFPREWIR